MAFWIVYLLALNLQDESFIDKIMWETYKYNYANKLFISSGEINHDTAEDLQRFLRNQNQK